jgi:hypothetical protein
MYCVVVFCNICVIELSGFFWLDFYRVFLIALPLNLKEMTANLTLTPNSKKTRNIKRERQPWPPTEIPDLGQAHRNVMGLN